MCDIPGLELTDAMNRTKYNKLLKSVRNNGFTDPIIKYTMIDDTPYVLFGSNRIRVARRFGLMDNLIMEQVGLPFHGYKTTNDVISSAAAIKAAAAERAYLGY
ncbi:MAG: hypothetical protein JW860_01180 [Sedimentisphaerales bacterium]|nr:hypothetical protein [Sedimentisphaerales bacterium]